MTEDRTNEALEKLSRGIQESKQMVQHQTMQLAQEYFGDSVEAIKQQIKDNRATLKDLPEQIPGGQEEPFQMLFQELMDNYTRIEESLSEADKNVANLDTEQLIKQGEVDASDAARREARELGVDLTEVEGTGSGGRIVVDDVKSFAEEKEADEEPQASDAAKREAENLGVDLQQVTGTGSGGSITVKDVTDQAEGTKEEAADLAGQVVDGASDTVEGAASAVERVADRIGGAVEGAAEEAGQATGGDGSEEPRATNAARRKAEELGVDLSKVKGSGAGGLITIRDVAPVGT
jgi:pyruvate/2-oxoglutarate dehydrogenase complex dihydrolipoamide acyltransferase (E2) component